MIQPSKGEQYGTGITGLIDWKGMERKGVPLKHEAWG